MQFIEENEDGALKRIEDISATTVERRNLNVKISHWRCASFCVSVLCFVGQMSDE